jgi:probable rRNA maturation factor
MVLNRQRRVPVPVNDLERFLARARRALRLAPDSLTVCLVTNAEIARWNRAYRGKPAPTDVLSFPVREEAEKRAKGRAPAARRRSSSSASSTSSTPSASYLGDIAIAPAVARRNARRFGRTFDDEMRILILHGILHLMGYDHETDTGQMDRREQRLRRALGIA